MRIVFGFSFFRIRMYADIVVTIRMAIKRLESIGNMDSITPLRHCVTWKTCALSRLRSVQDPSE